MKPVIPPPEERVRIPNGQLETEDSQGAKFGAKLWRNKYLLIITVLLSCLSVPSVIVFARTKRTPGRTPGAVAPSSASPLPCPNDWIQNGTRCYFFSDTELNWNDSQSNCSSFGGSLVTMETQEEMDFIRSPKNHTHMWIGLRRENIKAPWKRPNGSIFHSRFHIEGEGLCAYLSKNNISSTNCNNNHRYWICSKLALPAREMPRTLQTSQG